jgi:hypothetical protein
MTSGLAEMELELRLLPGVVNVGFGPLDPSGHVAVTVVAFEPEADLEVTATRLARGFQTAATIEVIDLSPPRQPGAVPEKTNFVSDERVALVVSSVDEAGQAAVELSWMGARATGAGAGGVLIGPARATLGALRGLGIEVDAVLASVSTGRGVANSPVRVILRSEQTGDEFVGIAQGASLPESAARATLAGFNRYAGGRRAPQH